MDFYTAVQHTPAWVLILGLVMLCILACIFFSMLSASKLPKPKPKNEKCYRPGCTGKMINQVSRSENHKAYDIYVCNICGSAKGVEVNNMGRR